MEVLNGTIGAGDKIAYATSNTRYGGGMRIGFVSEITGTERNPRLKVLVTQTSGGAGHRYDPAAGRWVENPYLKTIDGATLKTIVKLNDTFRSAGSDD